jgi:predicted GIY-YIG superfamily endonuclease
MDNTSYVIYKSPVYLQFDKRYKYGKIYCMYLPDEPQYFYIGSTIQTINKRLRSHKSLIKKANQGKQVRNMIVYTHFATDDRFAKINSLKIQLVENYPCNNKRQLEIKEAEYIQANKDCLNVGIPSTSFEYLIRQRCFCGHICHPIAYEKHLKSSKHKANVKNKTPHMETPEHFFEEIYVDIKSSINHHIRKIEKCSIFSTHSI